MMRSPVLPLLALLAAGTLCAQHSAPSGNGPVAHSGSMAPATAGSHESSGEPGRGGRGPGTGGAHAIGREQASGFNISNRPPSVPRPQTNAIIAPGPLPRCTSLPTAEYWGSRDLEREIQGMARSGYVPVYPDFKTDRITGVSWFPAGWVGYAFVVPPKGKLHIRLHHPNEGWFRLIMLDRWGQRRKQGMLQNIIPTGNPEVSFYSPLTTTTTVYVIVDDPGYMSVKPMDPFVLSVDRDWDPDKTPTPTDPPVFGIWAKVKDKPEPAA